ncbi:oligosaccharyl transferase 48 kDa subunit [Acrasis kona]|uniref:Dolichyl-diphosphooligosaccharide--protein glycosyltransferase 48 kDa subunit n=1 Tax=Acrasis kona TaxID=1008807 RepID=A0AAW2ZAI3_9EUKA
MSARSSLSLLLVILYVVAFAQCQSDAPLKNSKRTLVVLDTFDYKVSHSKFFQQLTKKGHKLTYKLAFDQDIVLSKYDDYHFDNLIIISSSKRSSFGGELKYASALSKFVDNNAGNVFVVAGSSGLSKPLREFATENGVGFDDEGTSVIDHFNYDVNLDTSFRHTVVACNQVSQLPSSRVIRDAQKFVTKPILYSGLAISLDRHRNKLLLPILTGSSTSYSFDADQSGTNAEPSIRGRNTVLVGALQARNGARITFVGGSEVLSDKYFSSQVQSTQSSSGNEDFSNELISWSFQDRCVIRHSNVSHHLVVPSAVDAPGYYKVGELMDYSVIFEEWDGDSRKWVPFVTDDVQLELIMLHPYVRTDLKHVADGKYAARVKVPDTYGVFKLHVDYRRDGLSHLIFDDQITIRPTRIEEFERFVPAASPYYTIMFSTMATFFVFSTLFLYTREKPKTD